MNSEQIKPKEGQNETSRFFEGQVEQGRNQDVQLGYQRQGVGGANRSFEIATLSHAYDLWRALKVLASAAETGKALIAPDGDALRITTYDWIKTKAAVLKASRKGFKLVKYNTNAVGRYYVVDVWELYEAVDKLMGHVIDPWGLYMHGRLGSSKDNMTIGVEDDVGEEVTVYVEIDGKRERLRARPVGSHKVEPSLRPAASVLIKMKPFLGALTRARRTGAEYVDIAITPDGLRIKGGKYVTEVGGGMVVPGVIEGRYPMSVVYDIVSHSTQLFSMIVQMTAGKLLYFDYASVELTAYIVPVY